MAPRIHPMATRSQGRCINLPDDEYLDNSDAGVFRHQKTDNVMEALAKDISSIPPHRPAAFMPVMNTESLLQFCSPPPTPTPVRVAQKVIKPLTSKEPSNQYSQESTASIASSLAPSPPISLRLCVAQEDTKPLTPSKQSSKDFIASSALLLPTPDKTPRNRSRREESRANVKLESSPSPEIAEISREAMILQNKPHATTDSSKKSTTSIAPLPSTGLLTPVNTPPLIRLRPLHTREVARESNLSDEIALDVAKILETYYHGQNNGSPVSVLSAKVKDPQYHQFKDTVTSSTTKLGHRCGGPGLKGPCMRRVKSPGQLCYLHKPASDSIQNTPITPKSVLRNGIAKESNVQWKEEVPIAPGQPTNNPVNSNLSDEIALDVAKIFETYYHGQNNGSPASVLSAKVKDPQYHQFKDTVTSSTTKLGHRCGGPGLKGPCMRRVKSPGQLCYLHKPASDSIQITPITPKSVLRNGIAKGSNVQCKEEVPIIPGQPINNPVNRPSDFSIRVGGTLLLYVDDRQFKVQQPGRKDVFVAFCDHIPPYLQPETQKKLRTAITREPTGRDKVPGYVYALNITDFEQEGNLLLKVGYSGDVKRRHAEWKKQCPSYIGDIRGCWPGPINKPKYLGESLIEELVSTNQQCPPGLMAAHVERLVHIELADLARHAPYLRPNFPNINYTDVPPLEKAERRLCRDCVSAKSGKGTEHREIFSFRRVEEGVIVGREWECIIEPVIRRGFNRPMYKVRLTHIPYVRDAFGGL